MQVWLSGTVLLCNMQTAVSTFSRQDSNPHQRKQPAHKPHLRKLHRDLVVDRQQLPLARLDGRIAAGAALSLRK